MMDKVNKVFPSVSQTKKESKYDGYEASDSIQKTYNVEEPWMKINILEVRLKDK